MFSIMCTTYGGSYRTIMSSIERTRTRANHRQDRHERVNPEGMSLERLDAFEEGRSTVTGNEPHEAARVDAKAERADDHERVPEDVFRGDEAAHDVSLLSSALACQ